MQVKLLSRIRCIARLQTEVVSLQLRPHSRQQPRYDECPHRVAAPECGTVESKSTKKGGDVKEGGWALFTRVGVGVGGMERGGVRSERGLEVPAMADDSSEHRLMRNTETSSSAMAHHEKKRRRNLCVALSLLLVGN